MPSLLLLMTSFPTEADAVSVIRALVEERLAACGTLLPKAHSIYIWQEKIEEADEVVVFLKTSEECLENCQERLQELHPYDVPELIVIEPHAVDPAYLHWMQEVLKKSEVK